MEIDHNLYIHIPFCISKCKYCAFFSSACANPDWENFTKNILEEIKYWSIKLGKINIPTIFFGGGTPSLLPEKYVEQIINEINKSFHIDDNCELSLEANPGTINKEKLQNLKNIGINRISIGAQSFDDNRLIFLGRKHSAGQAIQIINDSLSLGFRTSADFIYGLPQDTPEYVAKLCSQINAIGLEHCSLYELTIEPNTPFGKMNLDMPSNEHMAQMYETISEKLCLPRYEVSNYAKPGQECRHNQNVWDGEAYIGIGKGAAGRPFIKDTWYEQLGDNEKFEPISNETRTIEKIITGLRQTRGVKLTEDIKKQIDFHFINKNPDLLIISQDDRLKTTNKGLLVLDYILSKLVK